LTIFSIVRCIIVDKDTVFINNNTIQQQWKSECNRENEIKGRISFNIVSDAMQRESAIADDFWRYTFKHTKKNRIEVVLENIERK
jgi:hypothetical protein